MLLCMKNTALGCVSRESYRTRLRPVLYGSLNMPPHAVFSIHMHGGALTITCGMMQHDRESWYDKEWPSYGHLYYGDVEIIFLHIQSIVWGAGLEGCNEGYMGCTD